MSDPLYLDDDQERDAQRIAREPTNAAGDFSTMSSGKTVTALRAAKIRGAQQILVIAPLQTRGGWESTAKRGWVPPGGIEESYADLPFYWIKSDKDGEHAKAALQFGSRGIYFVGHAYAATMAFAKAGHRITQNQKGEEVRKVIKKKTDYWNSVHPDFLVVDEVHVGSTSTSTQTHKTLTQMRPKFKLAMSGTPAGNRFDGIYPVTKFLWPDLVETTPTKFKARWCETVYDAFIWDHMKVVGEKNPGAYFASLPCVVRREWEYEGVIDEAEVFVDLSAAQRKAYNELEKNMVTWLDGVPFTIEFPPALRIRLRQATLGMFHVADDGSIEFADDCKSSKLDALKGVLKDDFQNESALILTDSKRFAKVTVNRINSWHGEGSAELWSGDQSTTVREEIKARFISGETKFVVMVVKAGGTGSDLIQMATRNIAVLSRDDSRIQMEQALARVVRRGQGDLVRIREIMANDTYDMGILHGQLEQAVLMRRSLALTKPF